MINDLLLKDSCHLDTLSGGRFHQQLRDTFAPLVVRYVDLMESCIAQSIHKGFEKENWKIKTYDKQLMREKKLIKLNFSSIDVDVLLVKKFFGNLMFYKDLFEIYIGFVV